MQTALLGQSNLLTERKVTHTYRIGRGQNQYLSKIQKRYRENDNDNSPGTMAHEVTPQIIKDKGEDRLKHTGKGRVNEAQVKLF